MLNNLGSFGLGNSNFAEVQAQMQQQVMSNPEFMRQMLDNPMVQSLMSNPDVIRDLMMSNPQMQSLIEVEFCLTIHDNEYSFVLF
jgi:ubiquilin